MYVIYYSIAVAVAFVAVLFLLFLTHKKLKSVQAEVADKTSCLEKYSVITDAEEEALRIVSTAKEAAEELVNDSQRILDEAKVEAASILVASETDAESIKVKAADLLSDARIAASRLNAEALSAIDKLRSRRDDIEKQIDDLRLSYREKKIIFDELEEALSIYKDDMDFAEMGFYAPHFEFDTSEVFQEAIRANRQRQKDMLRVKTALGAIYCTTEWTVSGSKSEGKKMTTRAINMT